MSTIANRTRTLENRQTLNARGTTSRTLARRVADWWASDSMTPLFSAERERELRKLQRAGCRTS